MEIMYLLQLDLLIMSLIYAIQLAGQQEVGSAIFATDYLNQKQELESHKYEHSKLGTLCFDGQSFDYLLPLLSNVSSMGL